MSDPSRSSTKREAILRQNELLRGYQYADVRVELWRCPICARRRCRDAPSCREKLEEWTRDKWDAAIEAARFRAPDSP